VTVPQSDGAVAATLGSPRRIKDNQHMTLPTRGPEAAADERYTFTVFTPTRNRGHVLHRVYESLQRQTFREFEWLIVDNDSDDDTPTIVAAWQAEADFPIRYVRHANRGLHVSRDRAVREARGELFMEFRSADSCMPEAFERFMYHWLSIPEAERRGFVGVTALVMNERGTVIGKPFPRDVIDSNPNELFYRYGLRGERWGFQRTDVLRDNPVEVMEGYTGYVPEGAIWSRIGRRYRTRFVNEVLRVYWLDQPTSLSNPVRFADNALGGLIETQGFLDHDVRWFAEAPGAALLRAAKYVRCSLHVGRGIVAQWRALHHPAGRALWAASLPLGFATYIIDRTGNTRLLDRLGIEKT
jgi:hypothetical protein